MFHVKHRLMPSTHNTSSTKYTWIVEHKVRADVDATNLHGVDYDF